MPRPLPGGVSALGAQLAYATVGLWRFEQQTTYRMPNEEQLLADFRRGTVTPPDREPGFRSWFDLVRAQTALGIPVVRVRVVDEPATEYQRWMQAIEPWSAAAGERIRRLPRRVLHQAAAAPALLPADADMWVIDLELCVIMHFDPVGQLAAVELADDPAEVAVGRRFMSEVDDLARGLSAPCQRAG